MHRTVTLFAASIAAAGIGAWSIFVLPSFLGRVSNKTFVMNDCMIAQLQKHHADARFMASEAAEVEFTACYHASGGTGAVTPSYLLYRD